MKLYLGIKFHEDLSNKSIIDKICKFAKEENCEITCMHRDVEKWGGVNFTLEELMNETFKVIDKSNAILIEFSESGTGIGIEAGYAVAKNIPVYILIPEGKELSPTMKGISKKIYVYRNDKDIINIFKDIKK